MMKKSIQHNKLINNLLNTHLSRIYPNPPLPTYSEPTETPTASLHYYLPPTHSKTPLYHPDNTFFPGSPFHADRRASVSCKHSTTIPYLFKHITPDNRDLNSYPSFC